MLAMAKGERKLISQAEAARIAGVHPSTVLRWIRGGVLKGYKRPVSPRKLVDEDELREKLRAEEMEPEIRE